MSTKPESITRSVVIAVVIGSLTAGVWYSAVRPVADETSQLRAKTGEATSVADQALKLETQDAQARKSIHSFDRARTAAQQFFRDPLSTTDELRSAATNAGVTLSDLEPGNTTAVPSEPAFGSLRGITVRTNCRVTGSFNNVSRFLAIIEQENSVHRVCAFTLEEDSSALQPEAAQLLRAKLSILSLAVKREPSQQTADAGGGS